MDIHGNCNSSHGVAAWGQNSLHWMCLHGSIHSNKKVHRSTQDKQGFVISFMEMVTRFLRRAVSWQAPGTKAVGKSRVWPCFCFGASTGTSGQAGKVCMLQKMTRKWCTEVVMGRLSGAVTSLFLISTGFAMPKVPFIVLAFGSFKRNLKWTIAFAAEREKSNETILI